MGSRGSSGSASLRKENVQEGGGSCKYISVYFITGESLRRVGW